MSIALNLLITLATIKAKYSKEYKQWEEVYPRVDSLVRFARMKYQRWWTTESDKWQIFSSFATND